MEITLSTAAFDTDLPVDRDWDTFTRPDVDYPGLTEGARLRWELEGDDAANWMAGIRDNQLSVWRKTVAPTGTTPHALCVVDTGKSNGRFGMRLNAIAGGSLSSNATFVFRYVDPRNFLWIYASTYSGGWSLYKMVDGVATNLRTGTFNTAGMLEAIMYGQRVVIRHDDTPIGLYVDVPEFVNATKCGVRVRANDGNNMSGSRFDDFHFYDHR